VDIGNNCVRQSYLGYAPLDPQLSPRGRFSGNDFESFLLAKISTKWSRRFVPSTWPRSSFICHYDRLSIKQVYLDCHSDNFEKSTVCRSATADRKYMLNGLPLCFQGLRIPDKSASPRTPVVKLLHDVRYHSSY
jgi:hypothetical protein